MSASVGPTRPSAASTAPTKSSRWPGTRPRPGGIFVDRASATSTNGTLTAKISRQEKLSTSCPPTSGPDDGADAAPGRPGARSPPRARPTGRWPR